MTFASSWMHVDLFTVDQAAAIWCGVDPTSLNLIESKWPPDVGAIKQMLAGAIVSRLLDADSSRNGFELIGDFSKSFVSRANLENFAKTKKLYPAFLFDTQTSFGEQVSDNGTPNNPPTKPAVSPVNVGGRPAEYDWNSFTFEIIRLANHPDGLPETQAELIHEMLAWFSITYGTEPAESSVKQRISKIYKYLAKDKNPPD